MIDWDELFAHVVACTGWTWDQVGQLTIPRLTALNDYWFQNPPVHLLVKWFVGYDNKKSKSAPKNNDAAMAEFFAMFPEGRF